MTEAFVYDAIRTPRGRGKKTGSLHEVKPISLLTGLLDELKTRNPDLAPNEIDDVILGVVSPVGDQGADIARTAVLAAGFGEQVAGVQLNRFCGSGLESINQASARVKSGWEDLIVAGGVESMSRVPMASDGGAWAMDPKTALETDFVPQGIGADLIATLEGFSRTDVDTFAAESQARAAKAIANGYFDKSVIPVKDINGLPVLDHDEFVREGTTVESLSSLGASFAGLGDFGFDAVALEKYITVEKINHVHHAGNSSGIVDGASLVLIGNEKAGERHGLTPRARIVSTAVIGSEPTIMLTGPGPAARKALAKAGLQPDDIDLIEINEAFAAVAMKLMRDLDDYPHEQTNVNGGAIAMGHPLGATGGMILGTLVDELERREKRYGLATLCIGGGMGIATIVERI
ncbi:acetyl-CoA acetyltransferase [Aeromicrobium sp. Root495]|uniref:acetyl-CoA C-acetyltransferase n=1 Tax=Aeromicrobium sp. Root495 TaxID=1736550 RepID=UPI0006FC2229|nr:acetyl-CoA C-acetyltransferase [Aeromicrobium sp. Root495]KQY55990.1 acetyl-CoA acetyltransferase [Aeromicrobium sp. Root495]